MKTTGFALLASVLLGTNLHADPLEIGAKAPAVTAPDEAGKPVDLGAIYAGGLTLVYFYPKADTPGCTAQACSLRDSRKPACAAAGG